MIRFRLWLLAVALCAPLVAGAQGQLNLYCSSPNTAWCQGMAVGFEKATGTRVAVVQKATGEMFAQVKAEAANPKGDIWWAGPADAYLQAAEEGLLDEYRSPNGAQLYDWAQRISELSKGRVSGVYGGIIALGYNSEVMARKKLPIPKCWKDLANPAYRDEIQMANPGSSGTAFNTVSTILQLMGEDEGFKFLAAMNKNVNQYTRSGSAGIRAAAKGETTIGITFLHDSVAQTVQGYPIKTVVPCEGTGYEIISSAIIKNGPNPEGARKWMDFVLSPAGQNVAVAVNKFQTPSNRNAQVHPMAPKPSEVKLIKLDLDKYGSKQGRERLLSRWENEVFKAPK